MPNENPTDANTSRMDDSHNGGDNHASSSHHMKHSPSDDEFYGSTAGNTNSNSVRNRCPMRQYGIFIYTLCQLFTLLLLLYKKKKFDDFLFEF